MDKFELAKLHKKVVENELGVIGTLDEDGDVTFKVPGIGHFVIPNLADSDPEYFVMAHYNFGRPNSFGGDRSLMLHYANEVNRTVKAGKVFIQDNEANGLYVSATVESFLGGHDEPPSEEILKKVILRNYRALTYSVEKYREFETLHAQTSTENS
jgi:hypothetical protein